MTQLTVIDGGDITPPAPAVNREMFRAQQAEAIRVLAKRTTADIIEIGERLIAAKATCNHGEWLPWLKDEFGWTERTAYNFINVVEAGFKVETVSSLAIDAGALFRLGSPSTPQAARDDAVAKAEKGDRITKEEADRLIEKATREAAERAITEARERMAVEKAAAIEEATRQLANDKEALALRLAEIERSMAEPDVKDICHTIEKSLGIKRMKPEQYKLLARLLQTYIVVGKASYSPMSDEEGAKSNENLKVSSEITGACRALHGAPAPADFITMTWPVQRNQLRDMCSSIIEWLNECHKLLGEDREDV